MKYSRFLLFITIFALTGCQKYYLTVKRETVDRSALASTYVGSPDPRQENPPYGQALTIQWRLPPEALQEPLKLKLKVLYGNFSQQEITYPVGNRRGIITYSLLDEDFKSRQGIITYKAEIINQNGKVLQNWEQVLWTQLIEVDDRDLHFK